MRYLPFAAAAAAVLVACVVPAAAKQSQHHHRKPDRVKGHVSVHLSGHHVLKGNGVRVRGKVRPSGRHRVKVVFRGAGRGVIRTRTQADGTFAVRLEPGRTGSYAVRAYGVHNRRARGSESPARRLTAYRLAGASYYGPGLYGNGVACGGTLMPGTMGVAHKTLPCGTKVKLRYHGRSVTVPVIDRGPYVAGRDYDLTEAVRNRLGFPGVDTVLASR
jgi:rare lipoprotein A (peptidoglycan hydrolase)